MRYFIDESNTLQSTKQHFNQANFKLQLMEQDGSHNNMAGDIHLKIAFIKWVL